MFLEMPIWMSTLFTGLIGLIVGSFVNVVVVRLPQGKSLIQPGSHCPHCKKSLRWSDNIPVLSYLLLKGKCRTCKTRISVRYPVIEIVTALLFLAVKVRFNLPLLLLFRDWIFVAVLVAITFIDLEHRIIPNSLSLGGLLLGLTSAGLLPELGWIDSFLGAFLGYSIFYSLAWIYYQFTGRSGLGGGDVKLLAMIGSFLGPAGVFATIFISSVFGSVIGIAWALLTKRKSVMKVSIPFGPFLVVGALYYYLLGDVLWFQFMTPM